MSATVSQKPAVVNVDHVVRGDTWKLLVTLGIDLDDYTIEAMVHPRDAADVELTIEEVDFSIGKFYITLEPTDSEELPTGTCTWCLKTTPPFTPPAIAQTRTILAGKFIVRDC